MKKCTKYEIIEKFQEYNEEKGYKYGYNSKSELSAVIVFKQENWNKPYTEKERSYRIWNDSGKAFFYGMSSNSIFGDCLDDTDLGVRLDAYDWKIEYCYFEN